MRSGWVVLCPGGGEFRFGLERGAAPAEKVIQQGRRKRGSGFLPDSMNDVFGRFQGYGEDLLAGDVGVDKDMNQFGFFVCEKVGLFMEDVETGGENAQGDVDVIEVVVRHDALLFRLRMTD